MGDPMKFLYELLNLLSERLIW